MAHIALKARTEIKPDYNLKELDNSIIPKESKEVVKDYNSSENLAEVKNHDILIVCEDKIVSAFDYLYLGKKKIIVEINPVTIFFSNSVMSFGMLQNYKKILLSQCPEYGKQPELPNLYHSGMFFQLAINCIINLQATLESFANQIIPKDYSYFDSKGNPTVDTLTCKLYNAIPKIKNSNFRIKKHRKYNIAIDFLIQFRNRLIHLKPIGESITGYKGIYRDLLDLDYDKTITAVKTFVNFYEPNLIEECPCGNNLYFDSLKQE